MHIRTQDYYIGECGCPQLNNNNNNGSSIKNILTNDSCINNKILAKLRKEMNDRKPKLLNARQTLNDHYQSLLEKYNNKYNNHNNNNNKNTKRKYEKIQEGAKINSNNYSNFKELNSNELILQQKQQKHKYNEFIKQQNHYNYYKSNNNNNNNNNNGSKSSNQNILDNRARERRSSTSTVDSDLELF